MNPVDRVLLAIIVGAAVALAICLLSVHASRRRARRQLRDIIRRAGSGA